MASKVTRIEAMTAIIPRVSDVALNVPLRGAVGSHVEKPIQRYRAELLRRIGTPGRGSSLIRCHPIQPSEGL